MSDYMQKIAADEARVGTEVPLKMSNYPPGVTGNGYAIAGPDFERDAQLICPTCVALEITPDDLPVPGVLVGYRDERWFICASHEHETDLDDANDE